MMQKEKQAENSRDSLSGKEADMENVIWKIADVPDQIRQKRPLVHMIPNSVTVALCTDGLAALGARPLMAQAPEEMDEIPAYADALVVNMGQPTKEKLLAAERALTAAEKSGTPIVWDPVGAGASCFRRETFSGLLSLEWKGIIKGNQSEIHTLQSGTISHQGIDSIGAFELRTRASDGRVWAVSGSEDLVFKEDRCYFLKHEGRRLMLTGSGCLTGAVMGACYAVEKEPDTAALAAFFLMAYAGERAAQQKGYGSQKCTLLDALTAIHTDEFAEYVRKSVLCGQAGIR